MCDSTALCRIYKEVMTYDNRTPFWPPALLSLNKVVVNTLVETLENVSYVRLVTKNFWLDV